MFSEKELDSIVHAKDLAVYFNWSLHKASVRLKEVKDQIKKERKLKYVRIEITLRIFLRYEQRLIME